MTFAPPRSDPFTDAHYTGDEPHATTVLLSWRTRLTAYLRENLTGLRGLVIAGMALAALYLALTLLFPITNWWYRTDDNLGTIPARTPWGKALEHLTGAYSLNIWLAVIAVIFILALFGLQGIAVYAARTSRDTRMARRLVIGFAALFVLIQFWMQPITSTDLYGYIARSYLIANLHQNPTIALSTQLPGDYLVPHARPPAPYGPIWLLICGLVGVLSGENLLLAMLLFKAIMAAATIGAIVLVAYLADKLLPGQRVQAIVLFAWSPLLIFEAVGNAHNDMVMMVCVLGSLAAICAKRPFWSLPILALGVLIKYSVGALLPLWVVTLVVVFCWRYQPDEPAVPNMPRAIRELGTWAKQLDFRQLLRIFGGGGALSIAIAAVCYAPFWVGFKTFTGLGQQLGATYFNGSIAELIFAALQWGAPGPKSSGLGSAIRLLLYAIYVVYLAIQTHNLWGKGRAVTVAVLAQMAGKVIFATLVLVTFWYQPWYIVWVLPLAALAPDNILRRHAAMLALGGMLTYVVQYFAFVNQPELERNFFIQFFLVIVAFAPLLILHHGGEQSAWRASLTRAFGGLSGFVQHRPALFSRITLGLILCVAAILRLVKLGSADDATSGALLRKVSGNLSLSVADARGLDGVFGFLRSLTMAVFGHTTFALLLPTAIIGTLTVWLIYGLTSELFAVTLPERRQTIALLAALFAATAQWHVALSRSGVEVVMLPLLVCAALLALWRSQQMYHQPDAVGAPRTAAGEQANIDPHRLRLLVQAGLCVGLMSDLVPSLWPMPVALITFCLVVWWRERVNYANSTFEAVALSASTFLAGLPTLWFYTSRVVGFPAGSGVLAYSPVHHASELSPFTFAFWQQVGTNLVMVTRVLITQDYDAAGPSAGGIPILPALIIPFVLVGAFLALRRWRRPEAATLAALAALPFVVSLAVIATPNVIEAATVLPIACILPALGLEAAGHLLATVPGVVTGPTNTVFISRQNLLRVALLLLLLVATVSTFFWYFAATLVGPTHQIQPL